MMMRFRMRAGRKSSQPDSSCRTIGVIGTGRGLGVTHFSIMTAGYLSGILRRRCAVLEWNSHGDFRRMQEVCCEGQKQQERGAFRILEVDYYRDAGTNEYLLCKTGGFQDIIVDYGAVEEGNLSEFFRCDRRFVIGSLSEWEIGAFLEFAGTGKKACIGWETLAVFGSEEARKNMEKKLGISIRRIPVSVDAFTVTSALMEFYDRIL